MLRSVESWRQHLVKTWRCLDERLFRQVSHNLCKPRNQWPVDELIERNLATLENPAVLDRRLKDLPEFARNVLALVAHSRQPRWGVGSLVELAHLLGDTDGLATVQSLLDAGLIAPLLFPIDGAEPKGKVRGFEQWLAQSAAPEIFLYPPIAQRCLNLDLPRFDRDWSHAQDGGPVYEADGMEWLLRLAVVWQQIHGAPLRRTQQRDFFKRDLDRLRGDPLLSAPPSDGLAQVPDPGLFAVALGLAIGLFSEADNQIQAESIDESWNAGLQPALTDLWAALPQLTSWNAAHGWEVNATPGNPYPAGYLFALVMLAGLPEGQWANPAELEKWIAARHPYWASARASQQTLGLEAYLLGIAHSLRLTQGVKHPKLGPLVRLSPLGRSILGFSDTAAPAPGFPQTILVQPNLEILAYRQGLTPGLIVRLTKLANWTSLGAACTLVLLPESVYRALESGESFTSIVQTLDRHGMKPTPTPVLDSLKTWSNKRDRLTVYPAAALFEFASAAELNEALSRGVPAIRLTDRLAVVAHESQIDYRHFRMTGTRDYLLPPERCVDVEADGVTLSVDMGRSDLLLDTEVLRFAELASTNGASPRRHYRITPASMTQAREKGMTPQALDQWFQARTGLPTSPAARLLLTGADSLPMELRRQIVLHVASEDLADGLAQWPETRVLIHSRLGPTTLAVLEKNVAELGERLKGLGIRTRFEDS